MKASRLAAIVSSIILSIASASFGEAWIDSAAAAIQSGRMGPAMDRVEERGIGPTLPGDFAAVIAKLKAGQAPPASIRRGESVFRPSLQRCLKDNSAAAFVSLVQDTAKPLEARTALMRVLSTGANRLGSPGRQAVAAAYSDMARSVSQPSSMRVLAVEGLMQPAFGKGAEAFLPFASSADSLLKAAGCKALARLARSNRAKGNASANRAIFDSLKAAAGEDLNLDEVRALAVFAEGYSRNYLLQKCAGSPVKVAAILYQDDKLDHAGILGEAGKLLAAGPAPDLVKALRHGERNMDPVIDSLLAGAKTESMAGLKLLAAVPEHASRHQGALQRHAEGSDSDLKGAAGALLQTAGSN